MELKPRRSQLVQHRAGTLHHLLPVPIILLKRLHHPDALMLDKSYLVLHQLADLALASVGGRDVDGVV